MSLCGHWSSPTGSLIQDSPASAFVSGKLSSDLSHQSIYTYNIHTWYPSMCSHSCFGFKEVSDFRMPGPVKNRLYADPSLLCSLPTSSVLTDRTKQCSFGSCTAPPTGTIPAKSTKSKSNSFVGMPKPIFGLFRFCKIENFGFGDSHGKPTFQKSKLVLASPRDCSIFGFGIFARKNCLWLRVCLARLPTRGLCEAFST